MIQKPSKPFRVVLPDKIVLEYATREEARTAGRRTGGKVQGFDAVRGWIPEKYVADPPPRNVLERFVAKKQKGEK